MSRTTKHEFEHEEVMAYLDCELNPARAAALAGHLELCDECREIVAQFRQLSERLLDFSVEATPTKMNAGVLDFPKSSDLAKKPVLPEVDELAWSKVRRAFKSPVAWALTAAAVIALVVVGVRPAYFLESPTRSVGYMIAAPADSVPASRGVLPRLKTQNAEQDEEVGSTFGKLEAPTSAGPMIAHTVSFTIVANNYDEASAAIDRLASAHGGYVQKLAAEARAGAPRQLSVTLRVPAAQLADAIAQLRKLGHVEQETRANDEVTDQYVDLQARLKSARATEQRLLQLLGTRTGKLEDVLAVEQELARTREEIESMDGRRVVLLHRVNYVTVEVGLHEEYHEQLHTGTSSTATGLHNSLVEGLRNLEDGVVSVLVFLFAYGPSILFWCALFLVPGFFVWRWVRSRSRE